MGTCYTGRFLALLLLLWGVCLISSGCQTAPSYQDILEHPDEVANRPGPAPTPPPCPNESIKYNHPEYTIAPPDVLSINAINLVPKPPYRISPFEGLLVKLFVFGKEDKERNQLVPGQPIDGLYRVESDGTLDLGYDYGSVLIRGLTIKEAKEVIKKTLKDRFTKADFDVNLAIADAKGLQPIRGDHLVWQDGKVNLGVYGTVPVTGLTIAQAKKVIEAHLSQFFQDPEIAMDVSGFNSKVYYIIFDLGMSGEQIIRLPINGNETVLDAIGQLSGLPPTSNRYRIWVARPSPADSSCSQVMPVDWQAITKGGVTATNYQLLPGDRIYVGLDPFIRLDQTLAKFIAPFERVFGIMLLGHSVIQQYATPLVQLNQGGNSLTNNGTINGR